MIPILTFWSELEVETMNNSQLTNIKNICESVASCIMKLAKSSEPTINEKIKFLIKEADVTDNIDYIALGEIFPVSIPNGKSLEQKKSKKVNKTGFEMNFQDKIAIFPSISEKGRFLAFNLPFEIMLRNNILECINKICKVEGDWEKIKEDFENFYQEKVFNSYVNQLAKTLNKEVLTFNDVDEIAQPNN